MSHLGTRDRSNPTNHAPRHLVPLPHPTPRNSTAYFIRFFMDPDFNRPWPFLGQDGSLQVAGVLTAWPPPQHGPSLGGGDHWAPAPPRRCRAATSGRLSGQLSAADGAAMRSNVGVRRGFRSSL